METRAGDPGAFARFDLSRVDSPAFVVDAAKLRANLAVLADVQTRAGVKVLAALKAFSMWSTAPIIGEYLEQVRHSSRFIFQFRSVSRRLLEGNPRSGTVFAR